MSQTRRVTLIAVAIALAALFCRLGFWQLARHEERSASVETRLERGDFTALQWGAANLPPEDTAGLVGRRVAIEGRYLVEHEIILRSRSSGGRPGVEVLTPLQVAPGTPAVVVLRGWLPAVDGLRADLSAGWDQLSAVASDRVEGVLISSADGRGGQPLWVEVQGREHLALGGIDLVQIREHLPFELSPQVVRASDPAPGSGALAPARALETGSGPHMSYAIQWFSFAVIGLVGTAAVLRKEGRQET